MEKFWILLVAVILFVIYMFLFDKLIGSKARKKYTKKEWQHWPTQLSYWQAGILYSTGFTVVSVFLLQWTNLLSF